VVSGVEPRTSEQLFQHGTASTTTGSGPAQVGEGVEVGGSSLDRRPGDAIIHPAAVADQHSPASQSSQVRTTVGTPAATSDAAVAADTVQVFGRRRAIPTTS
jgi:hypothetical protein